MSRTLLVDDEDSLRRLLARVLERAGEAVTQFNNSSDALAWAGNNGIDVLVTDVMLDGVDGFGLGERILQANPGAVVIFISGYVVDIEPFRKHHPRCAFLLKPFAPKGLLAAIASLSESPRP